MIALKSFIRKILCDLSFHVAWRSSTVNQDGEIEITCKYCNEDLSE